MSQKKKVQENQNNYYQSKDAVQEYIKLSKDVNGQNIIEKLEEYLPHKSTLIELGSGPGSDWELLNKIYQITGSDNSQEFLNHLKSKYVQGKFIKLDDSTLQTNNLFDGIYSNKVLHHLKDKELVNSIKNQARILNDNGIICHTFWSGKGDEVFKGMFVNYQNKQSLTDFFSNYFEIIFLENYQEFYKDDSLLLIAKKKERQLVEQTS